MRHCWPRSLMGQMVLAVAVALLLVQGISAFLIYRAQAERRDVAVVHAAAFRFLRETGNLGEVSDEPRRNHHGEGRPRGFRLEHSVVSPLRSGEVRNADSEAELARILLDQGVSADQIVVTDRLIGKDAYAWSRSQERGWRFGPDHVRASDRLLVAGARLAGNSEWLVARIRVPNGERIIIFSVLWQTLLIYAVVVAAIALILRRITRPLAALTGRIERFAGNPAAENPVEPQGPSDVRDLIVAHNAMEGRIAALLNEKDVMLGAIGHDLKTPLAALRVRIESVEDDTERGRMAATIEDITRSLDDILSLARVGRPSDPREQVELSALIASVVEEYEDMGEPVELIETQRLVLSLRSTWLRRGVRNLIGNALRYGGAARVSLTRTDGEAVIMIDDDGPGIPEAEIGRMMEPFTRGEPSRNSETGGAGLGLALARAIAEQHGGSLELTNRHDAAGKLTGLTSRLRLPI